MNIVAIIPARMGSSRFPGKPLADIHGIPMIGHVYYRTRMSSILSETYVATCDKEISEYVESIGGRAIMTDGCHERCSDRCAEALIKIEEETKRKIDIVVMVQGDEPMTQPVMIDEATRPLMENSMIQVSNLMAELKTEAEWKDPNEVKVVVDQSNYALYFSREPIPSSQKYQGNITSFKQVCVIPFTRECLLNYTKMEPTPLEIVESVDMNRFLEYGIKVKMIITKHQTLAVDTPEDLENVKRLMIDDSLMKSYIV